MAIFTIVSIPALIPFLSILFSAQPTPVAKPVSGFSFQTALQWLQYSFYHLLETHSKKEALGLVCILLVILFFLKNFFRYLGVWFIAPMRSGVSADLRQALFKRMVNLPVGYFTEKRKGDMISRISADTNEVEWSILNMIESVFRTPVIIIGCLIFMIYVQPKLTLFVVVLILLTGFIIGGISRQLRSKSADAQSKFAIILSEVEESLGGLRVIKAYNAQSMIQERFQQVNGWYRNLLIQITRRRDLSSPLSEFLGISVVAVLLWYGAGLVFDGEIQAETFIAFLMAFYNVIEPSKQLSNSFFYIQKGLAAYERVQEILQLPETILEQADAKPIHELKQGITFQNVSFTYPGTDKKVLNDISFTIPRGSTVALVGPSGAGKSTIADLLLRFYDVDSGNIYIDGIDNRSLQLSQLRGLFGFVTQEPVLFNDTIRYNILFGNDSFSDSELVKASQIAHVDHYIQSTDLKYETIIGDRGSRLSGGQRQRVTIARAILRNPLILLLDEATSSLDSESEKAIQEALEDMLKGRTAVIIAHRLATIMKADLILVLKDGKIIEQGSHPELILKNGHYKNWVDLQGF